MVGHAAIHHTDRDYGGRAHAGRLDTVLAFYGNHDFTGLVIDVMLAANSGKIGRVSENVMA